MKGLLFILALCFIAPTPSMALVHVDNSRLQTISGNEKNPEKFKKENKKFSIKSIFTKLKKSFTFDLSDPVDGWLSWAILLFAGAIGVGLVSWLLGGIYLLGFISSLLAITGLIFFAVYIVKLVS